MHIPNGESERDAMIAAPALEHECTVVTLNASDFKAAGVTLLFRKMAPKQFFKTQQVARLFR